MRRTRENNTKEAYIPGKYCKKAIIIIYTQSHLELRIVPRTSAYVQITQEIQLTPNSRSVAILNQKLCVAYIRAHLHTIEFR